MTPGPVRALQAARAVAAAHDVPSDDATVLTGGSNVLVHLKPAPVVARVMTATAVLHDDLELWLAREVSVGEFLGERGLAVAPTRLLPPGPHQRDGLWITLWDHVAYERSDSLPDATELGRSLRGLHEALAEYGGELDSLASVAKVIARLLDELEQGDSLRARLDELTPLVFDSVGPTQPIHADASLSNLLPTDGGLLWNDLEDVCTGPIQWDVAGLVTSARQRGADDVYVEQLLDAYGGPRLEELTDFFAADELYMRVWQSYDPQRRAH